jgi:nucleotide-binding universal stress UspA family protein
MSFTHTIVHATDFSESSGRAFEIACALARDQGARLIVVYVVPPPLFHGEEVARRQPDFESELWQKLRQLRDPAGAILIEHWLRWGDPAEEIVRATTESEARLIVMGTHGGGVVGRVLLLVGSVAEKVLRTAPCPVMTVRAAVCRAEGTRQTAETKTKGPQMLAIKSILHPTDFSSGSELAFQLACSLAREHGATVHVLHVASEPVVSPVAGVVPPEPEQYWKEAAAKLQQIQANASVRVEHQLVMVGDAASEILRVSKQLEVDTIVMGTHGRTGLRRLLMGSVAEQVVRGASCPVITVRPSALGDTRAYGLTEPSEKTWKSPS